MSLVVIGTGTGVGKTVTCALLLARYGRLFRLAYWKPMATGAVEGRDTVEIKRWCGHLADVLEEEYLFSAPLSPHAAATLEGKVIEPDKVAEALVRHGLADRERGLVMEGVGGLLVPLTRHGYLLADLLRDLRLPCLVVGQSKLGTINHTLLTLEALRSRSMEIAGVVLSGPKNPVNRDAIQRFGRVDLVLEVDPVRPLTRSGIARGAKKFDRQGKLRKYFL